MRLAEVLKNAIAHAASWRNRMLHLLAEADLITPKFGSVHRRLTSDGMSLFFSDGDGTLEGPLHSVTVAHARLIKPAEIRAIDGEFRLH